MACTKEEKTGRWIDGTAIVDKLWDAFHWVLDVDVGARTGIVGGIRRTSDFKRKETILARKQT